MTYGKLEIQNSSQVEIDKAKVFPEPPALLEYIYYGLIAYACLADAWGVLVPAVGGAMLVFLAGACVISLGSRALEVYAPIGFALSCAVTVVVVHALQSEDSLYAAKPFVGWLQMLMIVQALSLRKGFLHRFALAAVVIGLCTLPYVKLIGGNGVIRAQADGTGLANGNVLALWFGFCCIYFVVFGLETKRIFARVVLWSLAVGCLFVIGITVSRGPLLGVAVASIVAFRRNLKRSFLPLLAFLIFCWIVYGSGVFDRITDFYFTRGLEETGRGIIMPLAFQRFLNSPWVGVGVDEIAVWNGYLWITPHNGLLYIGLASGVIPLAFFLGYLRRAAWGAFRADPQRFSDAPWLLPLVTFAFLEIMIIDTAFMSPWSLAVLSLAATASAPPRGRRIAVSRRGRTARKRFATAPASGMS